MKKEIPFPHRAILEQAAEDASPSEAPGSTAEYVREDDNRCGVTLVGGIPIYYERFEARRLLKELTSVVQKWDAEKR